MLLVLSDGGWFWSNSGPLLEQFWGRELSAYDPDGPLPEIDPVVEETSETRGSGFHGAKARHLADQWRAEAKDKGLSMRQFVTSKTARIDSTFTGSYTAVDAGAFR